MFILARRMAGASVVLLLGFGLQTTSAAVRYVAPAGMDGENDCLAQADPCATISHALAQAGDGDVLELAAGEFTESNIVIDRSITLRGAGRSATFVQAGPADGWWADDLSINRVLYVDSGVDVAVHDVTIRHGCAPEAYGSGIFNEGDLTLTNSSVQDNGGYECGGGGGVYSEGILILEQSTIAHNFAYICCAYGSAGGLDNAGTVEIRESEIYSNHTDHFSDNAGIYNRTDATAMIVDSDIAENGSGSVSSGGIENEGTMTLVRSTVRENYSSAGYSSSISNSGELEIIQSSIINNFGYVSGIMNFGVLNMENSTVSGNVSEGEFGGVFNSGAFYSVNNTIVNNESDKSPFDDEYGSSNGAGGLSNSGEAHLTNTLIAGNHSTLGEQDCNTHISSDVPVNSFGFNLIENTSGCDIEEIENSGTDITGTAPDIEPLADNGGHGATHALVHGSPALDAIPSGFNGCGAEVDEDQRGLSRPSGAGCDIGAFELQVEAANLLSDLISFVDGLDLKSGVKNILLSALFSAQQKLAEGDFSAARERIDTLRNLARNYDDDVLDSATADQIVSEVAYLIAVIDAEADNTATDLVAIQDDRISTEYELKSNYPNPFNPSTQIHFHLPVAAHVTLVVYDMVGREVGRLADGPHSAGNHQVTWDAARLPSGVYAYRLESGTYSETRQMTLLK